MQSPLPDPQADAARAADDAAFDAFWRQWPLRALDNPSVVRREWDRLSPQDRSAAIAGIGTRPARNHVTGSRFYGGRYYLRHRLWEPA